MFLGNMGIFRNMKRCQKETQRKNRYDRWGLAPIFESAKMGLSPPTPAPDL